MSIDITGLPPERDRLRARPRWRSWAPRCTRCPSRGTTPGCTAGSPRPPRHCDPDLADRLCEADFLWRDFSTVPPFACCRRRPPGATLAEELDVLDTHRRRTVRGRGARVHLPASYAPRDALPAGRPGRCARRPWRWRPRAAPGRRRSPSGCWPTRAAVRRWLRRLFEDCEEAFFADIWRRVRHPARGRRPAQDRTAAAQGPGRGAVRGVALADPRRRRDGDGATRITVDKLTAGPYDGVRDPAVRAHPPADAASAGRICMVLHRPGMAPGDPRTRSAARSCPRRPHWSCSSADGGPRAPRCGCGCAATSRAARTRRASSPTRTGSRRRRYPGTCRAEEGGPDHTRRRGRYVLHQLDLTAVARLGSDFLEGVLR